MILTNVIGNNLNSHQNSLPSEIRLADHRRVTRTPIYDKPVAGFCFPRIKFCQNCLSSSVCREILR